MSDSNGPAAPLCVCGHIEWFHGKRVFARPEGWTGCRGYASQADNTKCPCEAFAPSSPLPAVPPSAASGVSGELRWETLVEFQRGDLDAAGRMLVAFCNEAGQRQAERMAEWDVERTRYRGALELLERRPDATPDFVHDVVRVALHPETFITRDRPSAAEVAEHVRALAGEEGAP